MDLISNLNSDGIPRNDPDDEVIKILRGNEGWHCDSTYMPIQSKCAIFSVHVMPSHGGAVWADMRAAYDALTDELKETIAPSRRITRYVTAREKLVTSTTMTKTMGTTTATVWISSRRCIYWQKTTRKPDAPP